MQAHKPAWRGRLPLPAQRLRLQPHQLALTKKAGPGGDPTADPGPLIRQEL